jgi:hypothetical protein
MIPQLVQRLERKSKVFWQGGVAESVIDRLEELLGKKLPHSFRRFLHETGGGGASNAWISGIEDGIPEIENRGTVLGDTRFCQEEHKLPLHLVVIFLSDEDVVWCLDTSQFVDGEYPVVAFDVFFKKTALLYSSFAAFFEDYVNLR